MKAYALRRLLLVIPTLFGVTLAAFALSQLMPGDPAREQVRRAVPDRPPSRAEVARARRELGLDRPLAVQYISWVADTTTGDLGRSYTTGQPVAAELARRIPGTLAITIPAALLAVIVAVPAGVLAALRHNRFTDHALRVASMAGACMPSFWLGLLLMLVFAVRLDLVPVAGRQGWSSAVLPVVTLTIGIAAILARFTRAAMLETLGDDYVRTATAYGLRRTTVVAHALRNGLLPIVTSFGLLLGELIAGVVVVEAIFNWPGVGTLTVQAVAQRDYPMIVAVALYAGLGFAVLNLLVDLSYGIIDPRVRLDRHRATAA